MKAKPTQDQILAYLTEASKVTMMIEDGTLRHWATQYMIWLRDKALGVDRPGPASPGITYTGARVMAELDGIYYKHFNKGGNR